MGRSRSGSRGEVPDDLRVALHGMVGLRNLLVHADERIDDRRIWLVATTRLSDFDRFAACVSGHLGT